MASNCRKHCIAISGRPGSKLRVSEFFSATYAHNKAPNAGNDYNIENTFSMGTDLLTSLQTLDIGIKFLLGR